MRERLLELIKNETPTDEICEKLNISKNDLKYLMSNLKNEGFNIENKLFYDGTTSYAFNRTIAPDIDLKLFSKRKDDSFICLAIADTHIGHRKENLDYLYIMYDYAIENNIHLILHLGDLLEGKADTKMSLKEQLEYFKDYYPYEKEIKNIIVFGNHEEDFVIDEAIDLSSYIKYNRDDMIPLGFGERKIKLDNGYGYIYMLHQGNINANTPGIRLFGHSHRYKYVSKPNIALITVPTLSDRPHNPGPGLPGALELEIVKRNNNQNTLLTNHLVITEKQKVKNISRMQQGIIRKK